MEPSTNRYPLSSICTIIPRSSGLCKVIIFAIERWFQERLIDVFWITKLSPHLPTPP